MKIAVVMINYNGIKDTVAAIESVFESSIAAKVILVDNNSTNDEASLISSQYPTVHVIKSKKNLGFSGGNNLGIRFALQWDFEYIVLLNNDTIVDSGMIEELVKYASKTVVVVPKMYYFDEPNKIWYGGGELKRNTGSTIHTNINQYDVSSEVARKCTFATGCCMMIHRDIFEKVGLLDESYFMYCEDNDFCIRLMMNHIDIKYVPKAKLWHKVSASTGGCESAFSSYYTTRNQLNCLKCHKDYFACTAYSFTLFKRCIKIMQKILQGNKTWKTDIKAIVDHKRGKTGESF